MQEEMGKKKENMGQGSKMQIYVNASVHTLRAALLVALLSSTLQWGVTVSDSMQCEHRFISKVSELDAT